MSSSEDREFVLAVMKGTFGVVQKMLSDGGFVKLSGTGGLTRKHIYSKNIFFLRVL